MRWRSVRARSICGVAMATRSSSICGQEYRGAGLAVRTHQLGHCIIKSLQKS